MYGHANISLHQDCCGAIICRLSYVPLNSCTSEKCILSECIRYLCQLPTKNDASCYLYGLDTHYIFVWLYLYVRIYVYMLCASSSCVHCRVLLAENGRVPVMQPRTCVVRNVLLQQLVKTSLFWFQPVQMVPQPLPLTACVKCANC